MNYSGFTLIRYRKRYIWQSLFLSVCCFTNMNYIFSMDLMVQEQPEEKKACAKIDFYTGLNYLTEESSEGYRKAREYFELAAEQREDREIQALACSHLACINFFGWGGLQDASKVAEYALRASAYVQEVAQIKDVRTFLDEQYPEAEARLKDSEARSMFRVSLDEIKNALCTDIIKVVDMVTAPFNELSSENDSRLKDPLLLGLVNAQMRGLVSVLNKVEVRMHLHLGGTPLHRAARYGHTEIIDHFSVKGDNLNNQDDDGRTALHIASQNGHVGFVESLVRKGVEIDPTDNLGYTPLMHAAQKGHLGVMEVLLHRANPEASNLEGMTALHFAAQMGHIKAVALLLKNGLTIGIANKRGWTGLHEAASAGRRELIEFLYANGSCISDKTADGWTALHLAAMSGQNEVVEFLLINKAEIHAKDSKGKTPLHNAVEMDPKFSKRGHEKVVELLVRAGADAYELDKDGMPPLATAAERGRVESVEFLIERSTADQDPLLNGLLPGKKNLLHWACERGHSKVVALLSSRGVDCTSLDSEGLSPLSLAIINDKEEIVELLLEKGVAVNNQSKTGHTPLHLAVQKGYNHLAEILLKRGASLEIATNLGQKAIDIARERNDLRIIRMLLENGAYRNMKEMFSDEIARLFEKMISCCRSRKEKDE